MKQQIVDSQLLAKNLRSLGAAQTHQGPKDVFFGAGAQIAGSIASEKAETRIAIYPIASPNDKVFAQGLTLALAALLEYTTKFDVYRILIPELELPSLGETTRIHGSLHNDTVSQSLSMNAEIPFGSEDLNWEISFSSQSDLLRRITDLKETIAFDIGNPKFEKPADYPQLIQLTNSCEQYLTMCWDFEYAMFLGLSGKRVNIGDFQNYIANLIDISGNHNGSFSSWLAQVCLIRSLLPGSPCNELAVSLINFIIDSLPPNGRLIATALENYALSGHHESATNLLIDLNQKNEVNIAILHTLANEYARAHRFNEACEVYQNAIHRGTDPHQFALEYARLLLRLYDSEQDVQQLPLNGISSFNISPDDILKEAVSAFHLESSTNPEHYAAKVEQLQIQMELEPSQFWVGFAELSNIPAATEELRTLIMEMQSFEGDWKEGVEILASACARFPDCIELRFAYAEYLLLINDHYAAHSELEELSSRIDDHNLDDTITFERLLLDSKYPEFEFRLGEISSDLQSGTIRESDLDFLENSLDAAPHQLDLYNLLAAAYQIHNDLVSAFEILLEAKELLGNEPNLLHHLSVLSWQMGEAEMALSFLQEGLRKEPLYIPLLVQSARFHLMQDEEELAKKYIIRAESLDEDHPSIRQLRAHIARDMSE